ncbi:MAG: hypothetical protein HS122_15370 [Opitutaceae bacterium]|nr:hypothetical protein [Opitutaceae bacterium]
MFPRKELTLLERRKAVLRMRIRLQRVDLAADLRQVLRPVGWIDAMQARWLTLPWGVRLATGSLGYLAQRALLRRMPWRARALLWAPVILKLARRAFPLKDGAPPRTFRVPSQQDAEGLVKRRRAGLGRGSA